MGHRRCCCAPPAEPVACTNEQEICGIGNLAESAIASVTFAGMGGGLCGTNCTTLINGAHLCPHNCFPEESFAQDECAFEKSLFECLDPPGVPGFDRRYLIRVLYDPLDSGSGIWNIHLFEDSDPPFGCVTGPSTRGVHWRCIGGEITLISRGTFLGCDASEVDITAFSVS